MAPVIWLIDIIWVTEMQSLLKMSFHFANELIFFLPQHYFFGNQRDELNFFI